MPPEAIAYYRGSNACPLPGRFGPTASWQGCTLEGHEIPAGDYGDSEFHCHLIALERGPRPYRLDWKENGAIQSVRVEPGMVFVRSQQPLCSLRLRGTQKALMLTIEARAMELALPEPFSGQPVELIPRPIGRDAVVDHLISAMEYEIRSGAPLGSLLLGSLSSAISLYLASRHSTRTLVLPSRNCGLSRDRLSRVLEYIDTHLATSLSLDTLAGIACLSSYHFGRMFKVAKGVSVHQYVLSQRIEKSKFLLRQPGLTLVEVAAVVGFSSQSQFTTAFRRVTGVTPGVWRLSHTLA